MKKIESLFITISLFAVIAVMGGVCWEHATRHKAQHQTADFPAGKYGAFLAEQHAIYVNDFDAAVQYANALEDTQYPIVQNTKYIAEFLSGLKNIVKVKVLPYHKYAGSKYQSLDMKNTLPEDMPTEEEIKSARETVKSYNLTVAE